MKFTKFAALALIAFVPAFAHAQTTTTTVTTGAAPVVNSTSSTVTTHSTTVDDLKMKKDMKPVAKNAFEADRKAATDTNPKPLKVEGAVETHSETTTTNSTTSTSTDDAADTDAAE